MLLILVPGHVGVLLVLLAADIRAELLLGGIDACEVHVSDGPDKIR